MIALDTNTLVRYLLRDDPQQAELARCLLQDRLTPNEPGLVTITTLIELCWVLRRGYRVSPADIRRTVERLFQTPQLLFEQAGTVQRALALGLDELADAIIHETGRELGCDKTLTFDRRFARLDGVELLKSAAPS